VDYFAIVRTKKHLKSQFFFSQFLWKKLSNLHSMFWIRIPAFDGRLDPHPDKQSECGSGSKESTKKKGKSSKK
jgi:hypothetical protein